MAGSRVKATPVPESVAEVAEHHRADVDGGAEVVGDPLLPPVEHGALGVPGVEDRAHGEVELLARLLRERPGRCARAMISLYVATSSARSLDVEVEVVGRCPARP